MTDTDTPVSAALIATTALALVREPDGSLDRWQEMLGKVRAALVRLEAELEE